MGRNIQLSFSEWKQINKEVPNNYYFELGPGSLSEWKKYLKRYPEKTCSFPRVYIDETVKKLKSPVLINTLCKRYWRTQDMSTVMDNSYEFIGFILNQFNNIDLNTTLNEWKEIRNKMNVIIHSGDKERWTVKDLVELFNYCSSDKLSSAIQIG